MLANSIELSNIEKLTHLEINCEKHPTLPSEIGDLKQLTFLKIFGGWEDSRFTRLPPEIGQLENLKTLEIHSHMLSALPSEIGALSNLMSLKLHCNNLTTLPEDAGRLENIQEVDFYLPNLESIPSIQFLKNLSNIDLDLPELQELSKDLEYLTNLKSLIIRSWNLTSLSPNIGLTLQPGISRDRLPRPNFSA